MPTKEVKRRLRDVTGRQRIGKSTFSEPKEIEESVDNFAEKHTFDLSSFITHLFFLAGLAFLWFSRGNIWVVPVERYICLPFC